MKPCHTCGNTYDKTFEVIHQGKHYAFDSFECAIQSLAPVCPTCQCRIIGHGVEESGHIYCCAHCAHKSGAQKLRDRA